MLYIVKFFLILFACQLIPKIIFSENKPLLKIKAQHTVRIVLTVYNYDKVRKLIRSRDRKGEMSINIKSAYLEKN